MENNTWDAVIVGSGLAGLACALSLPKTYRVALLSKERLEDANSYLAQGGICVRRGEKDHTLFVEDTLKAGQYKNSLEAVEILVGESEDAIKTLMDFGVEFTREGENLSYTKEAAHSIPRILYCKDQTGKYIMDALIDRVKKEDNISIFENCLCKDLLVKDQRAWGLMASYKAEDRCFFTTNTILATGGLGGMYKNTTNFSHIRGEGLILAIKYGVLLKDMSYIQIHPTAFYSQKAGRKFLLSESVRGEGAVLKNHRNERFVNELLPRDIVSKAIFAEMEKEKVDHEWLDFTPIPVDIYKRFPNICYQLQKEGLDPKEDLIPIVPAYHYTMGGIQVDMEGRTSLDGLYAIGEVACTGVHGKNRLASNSLLESVVFGKRTARILEKNKGTVDFTREDFSPTYVDPDLGKKWIEERIDEDELIKNKQL